MATDIREWKETLEFPWPGRLNWIFGKKDVYEVLFKERETEDGIRYYIAWVNLPGKLKEKYLCEGARSGHLIAVDTYDTIADKTSRHTHDGIRNRIVLVIAEHIAYQKEARD
jgi:hypothetical protein